MADFTRITGRLFTGGALNGPEDVQAIVAAGVTHVVDARQEFDDAPLFTANPAISYLWNPTGDDGQPKSVEYFQKTIEFSLAAIQHPHVNVYLHCAAGINRGPSNCLAVMMALGWDMGEGLALMKAKRPQVQAAYAKDAQAAVLALGYSQNS